MKEALLDTVHELYRQIDKMEKDLKKLVADHIEEEISLAFYQKYAEEVEEMCDVLRDLVADIEIALEVEE